MPRGYLESESQHEDDIVEDERYLRRTRRASQEPSPSKAAHAHASVVDSLLNVIPETEPEAEKEDEVLMVSERQTEHDTQDDDDATLATSLLSPPKKFDWEAGGPEAAKARELKLATAAHEHLAYDCPKGMLESRLYSNPQIFIRFNARTIVGPRGRTP